MGYSYAYEFEEVLQLGILPVLFSFLPSMALGIATYVLTALAFYTVAVRRGLKNAWLAWIPVADAWLVGSISDQYRYVAKGEIKIAVNVVADKWSKSAEAAIAKVGGTIKNN